MNKDDLAGITGSLARPNVMQVMITLKDPIDKEALSHALQRTMKRYPYYAFRVVRTDQGYDKIENPLPVPVQDSIDDLPLGAKEANYHMLAVGCKDDTIRIVFHHGMIDGRSALWFYKTLLYCYVTVHYDVSLDPSGIILPDSPIDPEEDKKIIVPQEDGDPLGFMRPEDPFQLSDPLDEKAPYYCYRINVSEQDFLSFGKHNDSSPVAMMTIFMAKVLQRLYPDNKKAIYTSIAVDVRNALHCPKSRFSNVYVCFSRHDPAILNRSYEELGTLTRGQIILQSDENNMRYLHNQVIDYGMRIAMAKDDAERAQLFHQIYSLVAGSSTYGLSYVGNSEWGALDPYVRNVYTLVTNKQIQLEVNNAGGNFCIGWVQSFKDDKYVKAFMKLLGENGIACECDEPFSLMWPRVEIYGADEA